MNEQDNRIRIYSYRKVWNIEKRIYSFQDFNLPVPVNPYSILYVLVIAFLFFLLGKVFPVFTAVPAILRFIAIPYILSSYLMKKKLDGKNPIKFFFGYLRYLFSERSSFMEQFMLHREKNNKVALAWYCSAGKEQRRRKQHV